MAINKTVNKSTSSHGAMRNCIEYVLKDAKIKDGFVEITGPYEEDVIDYYKVYNSFLEEKRLWGKDSGRMYAHNIISFHKDENISPEEAFNFGKEFAENWFPNHQTLICVHQDRDHVHIHMVTNTVSFIDGKKLHATKKDLQRMKEFTNKMCRERGLTIAEKGKAFEGTSRDLGEITAWSKDKYNLLKAQSKESFVADCALCILKVLPNSSSNEDFIKGMKEMGWTVNWTDKRKHITFINEKGQKVRDSNLEMTFNIQVSKEALNGKFIGKDEWSRADTIPSRGSTKPKGRESIVPGTNSKTPSLREQLKQHERESRALAGQTTPSRKKAKSKGISIG